MNKKSRKSQSSLKWLDRNAKDQYRKSAKKSGFRSRAIYKLEDINKKFKIFKEAKFVLDLGSAPGSWLQYMKNTIKSNCVLVGVDLRSTQYIEGVNIIKGDFTSLGIRKK